MERYDDFLRLNSSKKNYFPLYEGKIYTKSKNTISVISEAVGSFIAQKIYPQTLQYQIQINENGAFETACTDLSYGHEYDTMKRLYQHADEQYKNLALNGNLNAIHSIFEENFSDLTVNVMQMLIADMFIINIDRCPRNYGIAFDNDNRNFAYLSSFDFDKSIISWDKRLEQYILSGRKIDVFDEMHLRETPFVGMSDNPKYHQVSDLIKFCILKDKERGNNDYCDIINKALDEIIPNYAVSEFESARDLEINNRIKNLIIYFLYTRREYINRTKKEETQILRLN